MLPSQHNLRKYLALAAVITALSATGAAAMQANCGHTGNKGSSEAGFQDVVRTKDGVPVLASNGTCVRTKWLNDYEACTSGVTVSEAMSRLSQEDRTVYFGFDRSGLTKEAKAKLDSLAEIIRNDKNVRQARVIGFADRLGTPSYNEKLSQKRAEAVRNYLVSKGIVTAAAVETRWFGESVPATSCPEKLVRKDLIACLQKDRRVEVEVDYAPEVRADRQ